MRCFLLIRDQGEPHLLPVLLPDPGRVQKPARLIEEPCRLGRVEAVAVEGGVVGPGAGGNGAVRPHRLVLEKRGDDIVAVYGVGQGLPHPLVREEWGIVVQVEDGIGAGRRLEDLPLRFVLQIEPVGGVERGAKEGAPQLAFP